MTFSEIGELERLTNLVRRLEAENANLKDELEDGNGAYRHVMNEVCAGDEIHCTCVPHLRQGIAELKDENSRLKTRIKELMQCE